MERSLFAFIWRHSRRDQLILLAVTVLSFPLLYLTLELPKRIVNDAIDAESEVVELWGMAFTQVGLLALLCAGFLAAVLGHGLMKMRINTMKGILAERLLRRFRYTLISRILRFPQPYFRRTSQGELVSMVTSEAEPLGGLMGDAVAQPVFQGGQMLTIMAFLFIQNVWLGLAAVALIPLQAWLIPLLQRRINKLNKERVQEVRKLAGEIGETAAGVADLRLNGGIRRRLAMVTERLGRLFEIRYRIYRQKFFMKFLNNFITQLTPFFFFAIGGYLAIIGELTVGALVAALAAYKDLAGPWKELLAYYNQVQDMSLRWHIITERFAPAGMIDEALFEGRPSELPRLSGDIVLDRVTLRDVDGTPVLENLSLELPQGATVGIASHSANERRAVAELIGREVVPSNGRITIAGQDLSGLHQETISTRIGVASTRPYLFSGTVGENLTISLDRCPENGGGADAEAIRAGNSADAPGGDWTDPSLAGLKDRAELTEWWLRIAEAIGSDDFLFRRGFDTRFDAAEHPDLAERLVALRPEIARRIADAGLVEAMHPFVEDQFNPGLPIAGNLLHAVPIKDIVQEDLARDPRFRAMIGDIGLEDELIGLGRSLLSLLGRVFGQQGTEHPLFLKLGIDADLFERLIAIERRAHDGGVAALEDADQALLLTVPFRFTAERIGAPFPPELKTRILKIRAERKAEMRAAASDLFAPLERKTFAAGLTVLENAIFGKAALGVGRRRRSCAIWWPMRWWGRG